MMFKKLEKLILLKFSNLNFSHRLCIIFEEFLKSSKISISEIVLYFVKKIFKWKLREEIILFWIKMILSIILLRRLRNLNWDDKLFRRILKVNDFCFCLNHHDWKIRVLWLISTYYSLLLFKLINNSFNLFKLLFLMVCIKRISSFCSIFFSFNKQVRICNFIEINRI